MLARSCCLLAAVLLLCGLVGAADPPAEPSYDQSGVPLEQDILPGAPKIVLIAGSKSHGPLEHEFFAGTALLQKMLKQNGANGHVPVLTIPVAPGTQPGPVPGPVPPVPVPPIGGGGQPT